MVPMGTTALTHSGVWAAIDALAARNGLSPSALARRAGLSPTAFNRSKRLGRDGRPRWPSVESLAKLLDATGASLDDFVALMKALPTAGQMRPGEPVPADPPPASGFFEGDGAQWADASLPPVSDRLHAVEINDERFLPLYPAGSVILVSPDAALRRGDRVLVRFSDGSIGARVLISISDRGVSLGIGGMTDGHLADRAEIVEMARIVWASQ